MYVGVICMDMVDFCTPGHTQPCHVVVCFQIKPL